MNTENTKATILSGNTVLGIEFGSTRIKAVLTDRNYLPIASGSHEWENKLENGIWTYSLEDIKSGLQSCYKSLADNVKETHGIELTSTGAIGISAMMHGYLAFDKNDNLLVPFRTWRNTCTEQAAEKLSELFSFNIPQRWSIAHLYQAILNKEEHVKDISFFTTLAGYVHFLLSGQKVLGIGDASGMFPIDDTNNYDKSMIAKFDGLVKNDFSWHLSDILPKIAMAGENAGFLSEQGAFLLDPSGKLKAGIPMCPPEGDAGTGMVATNAVSVRTGNVSAGTSVFAMIVLEKMLSKAYPEIDIVTTPDGKPVAMVHGNNCSSDIDAWIRIFNEFASLAGFSLKKSDLYDMLYKKALEGQADCGGLVSFNYFSGEPVVGLNEGRPLFVRTPDANFSLANFMRTLLTSAISTLKIGMDILFKKESVILDKLVGHGGFFKTPEAGQRIMASIGVPVSVISTAGEGGSWGCALLAAFMLEHEKDSSLTLPVFLQEKVFSSMEVKTLEPVLEDVEGFNSYIQRFMDLIPTQQSAIACLKIDGKGN